MLERRDFVRRLLAERGDLLVVTGLGSPTYDVAAAGDHALNFYLWGAMGGAAMIGLGLALARPDRPVAVITGDGEMLMGLGSLATIAVKRPKNLSIVVLDNRRYGETGMQASHTEAGVDLVAMARACGIGPCLDVRDEAGLRDACWPPENLARDFVRPRADRSLRAAAGVARTRRRGAEKPIPRGSGG